MDTNWKIAGRVGTWPSRGMLERTVAMARRDVVVDDTIAGGTDSI